MSSPSTTISLGFGSFGSVNLLPTLGYGIGAQAQVSGEVCRSGIRPLVAAARIRPIVARSQDRQLVSSANPR